MHAQTSKALKAVALLLALASSASFAASNTMMVAKADTAAAPKFVRASAPAPVLAIDDSASYLSLAEAEMIGMGYASFDAVLAEALNTPTAAGPQMATVSARALVEAVVAQRMGGLMP